MSKYKSVFVLSLLALSALFFTVTERTHAQLEIGTPPPITQMSDLHCKAIVTTSHGQLIQNNQSITTDTKFRVTYVIYNDGPGVASNFTVSRGVNMSESGNVSLQSETLTLKAGEAKFLAPVYLEGEVGDAVRVWGMVDTGNVVTESNEWNNICTLYFGFDVVR